MRDDRPSATALLIAESIVFISRDPRLGQFVPPAAAQESAWFMEACSPHWKCLLDAMNKGWFRSVAWAVERATVPGILAHYVLRKRYLEEVTRRSLHEGFTQVVLLGAGFDTLALRLHREFSKVTFIEIDHPATQQVKTQALAGRGLPGVNVRFLPMDLTRADPKETLLASEAYDPEAATLFVAEGVLMYLKPDTVDRVFRLTAGQGDRRVRFAFTFMEPQPDGTIRFRNSSRGVDLWLWFRGEPFRWGIRQEDLASYLEARGYRLQELVTPEAFRRRYLTAKELKHIPLADGDHVCVAEW